MTEAETHDDWPAGIMFRPPREIGWQSKIIIKSFLMQKALLAADTGLGKSMMTMGVSGFAFEEGQIDLAVIICEANKLSEWREDFLAHTRLSVTVYHGPKAKRERILDGPLPQVLITTYETYRGDIAVFPPKGSRSKTLTPGPLMKIISGKRLFIAYDEVTRLGRRGSQLYKAHEWALRQLRKGPVPPRVIGLTATPMDTDLDNIFSEMRLIVPEAMPTVKDYEATVVTSRHPVYKTPSYSQAGKEWFRARCEPWIIRKRKTDPDVIADFPKVTEKFRCIQMHDDQYQAYRALEDLAWDEHGKHKEVPGLGVLLRLMAGDPLAVLESAQAGRSELAKAVAEEMGAELAGCSSAKAQELISLADLVMSGGGKLMVFTHFANTVLPVLRRRLGDRPVFTYHGGMSHADREVQKDAFRASQGPGILLVSDAAARGINVPEADVIVEYELATLHSVREQRKGRGDRLGRSIPLTFISFVLTSTIEGARHANVLLARNAAQDFMLRDDEDERYMTAADRRLLYSQARPRKAG